MDKDQLLSQLQEALAKENSHELMKLAEQAAEIYPQDPQSLFYLAEAYALQWKYKDAAEILNKLIKLEPNDLAHKIRLAEMQMSTHDHEAVIATYQLVLAQHPQHPKAMYGLAQAYTKQWKTELALPLLDQLIEEDPQKKYYLLRAKARLDNNQSEEALQDLQQASDGFDEAVTLLEVDVYKKLNQVDEVLRCYQTLIDELPDNTVHPSNAGHYLMALERFEQAEEYFGLVIVRERAKGWSAGFAYRHRAEARIKLKKYAEALEDISKILEKEEKNADAFALRAEIHEALNQSENALADYNKALELEKGFSRPKFLEKRAALLLKMKKFEQAKADYQELTEDNFFKRNAYFGLGNVAHQTGNLEEACKQWTKAKEEHHPQADKMIKEHCADILEEQNAALKAELDVKYAGEFEKNAQSPFLQSIFGKFWRIDVDRTIKQEAFEKVPKGMLKMLLETLKTLAFTITNQGILFINPFKEDIQAYYKIEEQSENQVTIYGEPLNGKEPKTFTLYLEDELLVMDGFSNDGSKFYMKESEVGTLSEADKDQYKEKLKNMAMNFLGTMADALKDAFKK